MSGHAADCRRSPRAAMPPCALLLRPEASRRFQTSSRTPWFAGRSHIVMTIAAAPPITALRRRRATGRWPRSPPPIRMSQREPARVSRTTSVPSGPAKPRNTVPDRVSVLRFGAGHTGQADSPGRATPLTGTDGQCPRRRRRDRSDRLQHLRRHTGEEILSVRRVDDQPAAQHRTRPGTPAMRGGQAVRRSSDSAVATLCLRTVRSATSARGVLSDQRVTFTGNPLDRRLTT